MAEPLYGKGKLTPVKGNYMSASGHNLGIVDMDTGEFLGLQGLPQEIDYKSESVWATVRIPGRNNPHYNYVGSEDTITLEISWYAVSDNKLDVISRCKWLESMSKADGFLGRPHLAQLHWGRLFQKSLWIVENAPYKIGLFDAKNSYAPQQATQIVTLKRFTKSNTTIETINDWKT